MVGMPLDKRVAIVTGAASGLGRAIALGLAKAGARVLATASRSQATLDTLAAEADRDIGRGSIVPVLADVTSEADCTRIVDEALVRFGAVHVLVNNAGRGMKYVSQGFMAAPTRFWEVDPATWRMIIDTNVNGPFLMSRAVVPHMRSSGWGRIVNVSMNYDTMRRQGFSPYGPSKAALESETIIWAQDLKDTGITVNAVLPGGPTDTGMIPDATPQAVRERMLRPDIMAPPIVWLASERSDGFTGRRIIATDWNEGDAEKAAASESGKAGWP